MSLLEKADNQVIEIANPIWDNLITQHYAVNDYLPSVRHMQRITVINDKRVK